MINYLFDSLINLLRSRIFWLSVIFLGLFSIIVYRLFDLQIVNENFYLNTYIAKSEKKLTTPGTRGCIYDRNGKLLAYNEMDYSIVIEDVLEYTDDKDTQLNRIIYETISIIEKNGDKMISDFPIRQTAEGEFVYTTESDYERERFLKDIFGTEELVSEEGDFSKTTAKEAYEYLLTPEKYSISDTYSVADALKIMRVRYKMSSNAYQKYITTTMAVNVSEKTVIAIRENKGRLSGVEVKETTKRVYNDSVYFSHILGYTGSISDAQLQEFKEAGKEYEPDDVVGKAGIELYMEDSLKGVKGTETVFVDSMGRILQTLEKTNPSAGNDIYLTVDADLQIAGYHIIEQELAGILISHIVNRKTSDADDPTLISINEVYFQLINNNIIDMKHFSASDASDTEAYVYERFQDRLEDVLSEVDKDITASDPVWMNELSEEYRAYYDYIYDELTGSWGIIHSGELPSNDEKKEAWMKNKISLKEMIEYYISCNVIDLTALNKKDSYISAKEIYDAIVAYVEAKIAADPSFHKIVYKYMIDRGMVLGSDLCVILYDQNVLKDKENWYQTLLMADSYQSYQFIIEKIKRLELTPQMLALDPCSGSIVITDVHTGDVLACVTYPGYDNNMFSGYVDENYWNKLLNDLSTPLYSRATLTRTAPGSTFKVLTAVAALEDQYISTGSVVYDSGVFSLVQPAVKCWAWPGAHGGINVIDALEVSCNYFFCQMGYDFSIDQDGDFNEGKGLSVLRKYGEMFGLTSTTGIELDENEPLFSTENPVTSSIGQGSHSFTNVQISRYVAAVASKGNRYRLSVLDRITDSKGNVIKKLGGSVDEKIQVSDNTWNAVWTGMRRMVTSRTSIFGDLEIPIAGKTGTAQENLKRPDHGLFISFGPYDNPEIVVTTVLPHSGTSTYACEATKRVYQYYYSDMTVDDIVNEYANEANGTVIRD